MNKIEQRLNLSAEKSLTIILLAQLLFLNCESCSPCSRPTSSVSISLGSGEVESYRLHLSASDVTGAAGAEMPVTIFFSNESNADCFHTRSFGEVPPDYGVVQVSHEGLEIKEGDPTRLAYARWHDTAGGSSKAMAFKAHSTYAEQVDLKQIFDFPRPGKWFFRFRVVVSVGVERKTVMSPILRVIITPKPLSSWSLFSMGGETGGETGS